MPKRSAGVLLYRRKGERVEVLLVHPGGPFWANKDEGAWSIPKGEYLEGEDPLAAARREFQEETGVGLDAALIGLGVLRQPGGKLVTAFAAEGDVDAEAVKSNTFSMEWPPKSGRMRQFPEVDRARWFGLDEAARKIVKGQRPILAALIAQLGG